MNKSVGFAYIALLASVAIIMLVVSAVAENVAQHAKREREKQLFFVGEQFRNAIASYYENSPGGNKQFPISVEALLSDKRQINVAHHLRRLYLDPVTNSVSWGWIKNTQQQIIGVHSLSFEQLLKTDVDVSLVTIKEIQRPLVYSDLEFIYTPQKNRLAESSSRQILK